MAQHYYILNDYPDRPHKDAKDQRLLVSYILCDSPPSAYSSRIVAEEIDGLSIEVAIKVLKTLYETVIYREGWQQILCYEPFDYDPEAELVLQPWEVIDETD